MWSLVSTSQKDGVEYVHISRVMDHMVFEIAWVCWYQKKNKFFTGSIQVPSQFLLKEFKW